MSGESTLSHDVTISSGKSLSVGGSLAVSGESTLNDDVTIANGKSLSVGGGLFVTGGVDMHTLNVSVINGVSTINGQVYPPGGAVFPVVRETIFSLFTFSFFWMF